MALSKKKLITLTISLCVLLISIILLIIMYREGRRFEIAAETTLKNLKDCKEIESMMIFKNEVFKKGASFKFENYGDNLVYYNFINKEFKLENKIADAIKNNSEDILSDYLQNKAELLSKEIICKKYKTIKDISFLGEWWVDMISNNNPNANSILKFKNILCKLSNMDDSMKFSVLSSIDKEVILTTYTYDNTINQDERKIKIKSFKKDNEFKVSFPSIDIKKAVLMFYFGEAK